MGYTVYIHTNLVNNKKYVGVTAMTTERRWQGGYGYRRNEHFWSAIQKYGWENFSHEVLYEGLNREEAYNKEIELIARFRANDPEYGYNNSIGGEFSSLGCHMPLEARRKLSALAKERVREKHPMYGRRHTEESKKKMSATKKGTHTGERNAFYGKCHSEETRKKLAIMKTGTKHSEETKKLMSEIRKGRPTGRTGDRAVNSIPIICIETGKVYSCAAEAGRELNIARTNITRVCKGKGKSCKGLHFKYYEDSVCI